MGRKVLTTPSASSRYSIRVHSMDDDRGRLGERVPKAPGRRDAFVLEEKSAAHWLHGLHRNLLLKSDGHDLVDESAERPTCEFIRRSLPMSEPPMPRTDTVSPARPKTRNSISPLRVWAGWGKSLVWAASEPPTAPARATPMNKRRSQLASVSSNTHRNAIVQPVRVQLRNTGPGDGVSLAGRFVF